MLTHGFSIHENKPRENVQLQATYIAWVYSLHKAMSLWKPENMAQHYNPELC